MMPNTFTCLIPAYNEAERIGRVLTAIAGHRDSQKVTVIDDGYTDQTAQVARTLGGSVLTTAGKLGKTPALAPWLRARQSQYHWLAGCLPARPDGP